MWGLGLFLFDIHSGFSIPWFSTAVQDLYFVTLEEMPYVLYHHLRKKNVAAMHQYL